MWTRIGSSGFGTSVAADIDCGFRVTVEVRTRSRHVRDAKFLERPPVAQRHAGVDQRNFDELVQRLFLRGGKFRA